MRLLWDDSLYAFELEGLEYDKVDAQYVSGLAATSTGTTQLITAAPASQTVLAAPTPSTPAPANTPGGANNFDIARVGAQRVNLSFDNGGVAPAGNVFLADFMVPQGKVFVLDQIQVLISPTPNLNLAANTVLTSIAVNGNVVPQYNNIVGYPTDPFDAHLVVDENQHAQIVSNYAYGGTSFPVLRMFGRLYIKATLPGNYAQIL
jgi:hypothetical protein